MGKQCTCYWRMTLTFWPPLHLLLQWDSVRQPSHFSRWFAGKCKQGGFWVPHILVWQQIVQKLFSLVHSRLSTQRRSSVKLHSSPRPLERFYLLAPHGTTKFDMTNRLKRPLVMQWWKGPSPLRSGLPGHRTPLLSYSSLLAKPHPGIRKARDTLFLSALL